MKVYCWICRKELKGYRERDENDEMNHPMHEICWLEVNPRGGHIRGLGQGGDWYDQRT